MSEDLLAMITTFLTILVMVMSAVISQKNNHFRLCKDEGYTTSHCYNLAEEYFTERFGNEN